ncbi:disulfide bond formation protein B [Aquabacter spiritensis]|uniref:Disulfide bond formation protein DsbB n=1 Tax=Aquabacter spiritensis TaxID=933073 RepID=A0A4R3LR18_9HYPH|nr:disulfide bond formation protein B [Aquabacter spiritensis]TCT02059.1 disulfide bond formation protein DsbB [Aquabacter spiritensis]
MIDRSPRTACLIVTLGAVFALGAAWYFQIVVGLAPCPLCLYQRLPYYAAIPISFAATILGARGYRVAPRAGLWLLAALMFVDAGIAMYHAGIEWQFWQGPTTCSGATPVAVSDIMSALKTAHVPRCDEAAWRLMGLSMAGWNALIACALAGIAVWGATAPRQKPYGSSSVSQ